MHCYCKIFVMVASIVLTSLICSIGVWAQPFGMMSPPQQQKSQHQILSSANGRFVFGQVSDSDKDKFMLDTFTGRLWRITKSGSIGIFLTTVSYRISEGKYSATPENISDAESKEPENK